MRKKTGPLIWAGYLGLPIISVILTAILPLLRIVHNAFLERSPPTWDDVQGSLYVTGGLWLLCLSLQTLIAIHLGPQLRNSRWGLAFAAPALLGPTVAALLWKAILHPGRGLLSQALAMPEWDTHFAASAVVAFVHVWVWGLGGAAFVSAIFDRGTAQARDLYLLDGGRSIFANLWALWFLKRSWFGVLLFALSIENLRTYEIVKVLTGGVSKSATFAFHIYEFGWNADNLVYEAWWALSLIVLNGICTVLLTCSLRAGGRVAG